MAKVVLKSRRARPFWFGHPWVFSGAVERVRGKLRDGDVVDVFDSEGRRVGRGFWNGRSQIRVRMVALEAEGPVDDALFLGRLDRALALRHQVLELPAVTNAFRLVHAEGDGLPGLVVDQVGDWLVVQLSSLGMEPHLDLLLDRLEEALKPRGILERAVGAAEEEGLSRTDGVLRGCAPEGPVEVREGDTRYWCDPVAGQKTGFFADQRENRRALASLARGREVLDTFSYVGGFGLAMAQAGATSVLCVDSSAPALELLKAGAELNGVEDRVTALQGNVLRVLDHDQKEGRTYDLVVVDPPKLVHKRRAVSRGLGLYHEINLKAVRVLRPGGILVTCSCSQHVDAAAFEEMLGSVAKEASVRLQELYRGGQAADHPILLPHDESRYLECRAYRVVPMGAPA